MQDAGRFRVRPGTTGIETLEDKRHRDAGALYQKGLLSGERIAQVALSLACAALVGAGREHADGLFVEHAARHQPIEGVLQHARHAQRKLGAADEQGIGGADLRAPALDCSRQGRNVQVRIEMRQTVERIRNAELDSGGRQLLRGAQQLAVAGSSSVAGKPA